jgi:hypothetical protein
MVFVLVFLVRETFGRALIAPIIWFAKRVVIVRNMLEFICKETCFWKRAGLGHIIDILQEIDLKVSMRHTF